MTLEKFKLAIYLPIIFFSIVFDIVAVVAVCKDKKNTDSEMLSEHLKSQQLQTAMLEKENAALASENKSLRQQLCDYEQNKKTRSI